MVKSSADTKFRLWTDGANAWQAIGGPYAYCCPLCLERFDEHHLDRLTFEHVPPSSLGGKRLLLTCFDCNSVRGHKPDAHARMEHDVVKFLRGEDYPRLPVRFTDQGVNVEFRKDGNTNVITFLPSNNPPGADIKLAEEMATWGDGTNVNFQIRRPCKPRYASVSWLKTSYLVLFAWLGYRYVFGRALDCVRKQIVEYDSKHIPVFESFDAQTSAGKIAIIPELRCIGVTHDRRTIWLPIFSSDVNFYDRIVGVRLNTTCRRFGWPDRAMYKLDHLGEAAVREFCSLGWAAVPRDTASP